MTSVYVVGGPGPWLCDDDLIRCDGIYAGIYIEGVAHVDGIGGAAPRHERIERGLVRGHRKNTGAVRGRDTR